MDIESLHYFKELTKDMNMTQTAKKLYLSQQTLSNHIARLEKVDYTGDTLVFDVTCSKGTFIRTLCEDLAAKLGMAGTMSFLLRRKAGVFRLEDAHTLQEIAADPASCCEGIEPILAAFPRLTVNSLQGRRIAQGVATTLPGIQEGILYQLWTREGLLVGLARAVDGRLRAHKIIHIPEVEDRENHETDHITGRTA